MRWLLLTNMGSAVFPECPLDDLGMVSIRGCHRRSFWLPICISNDLNLGLNRFGTILLGVLRMIYIIYEMERQQIHRRCYKPGPKHIAMYSIHSFQSIPLLQSGEKSSKGHPLCRNLFQSSLEEIGSWVFHIWWKRYTHWGLDTSIYTLLCYENNRPHPTGLIKLGLEVSNYPVMKRGWSHSGKVEIGTSPDGMGNHTPDLNLLWKFVLWPFLCVLSILFLL